MGRQDGRDDEDENVGHQFVYLEKTFGTRKFANPKTESITWRLRSERASGWATLGGSNEVYIGTRIGVVRAYTVKRRDAQSQWDAELIKQMQGTPWQPDPSKP